MNLTWVLKNLTRVGNEVYTFVGWKTTAPRASAQNKRLSYIFITHLLSKHFSENKNKDPALILSLKCNYVGLHVLPRQPRRNAIY